LYNVFFCASYLRNDSRSKRRGSTAHHQHNSTKQKEGKRNSCSNQWRQCLNTLTGWFEQEQLEQLARQCGFLLRTPKKITPLLFLRTSILLVSQRAATLGKWAALLGVLGGVSVAKQSLWERIDQQAVGFLECILGKVIGKRLQNRPGPVPEVLTDFGRVLVQDSTTIKLSSKLAAVFPGASNHRGTHRGILKIQAVYELVSQRFVHFGLSGFTRNDQAAAYDILSVLKPGELVLRDLGYFVIGSLQQIASQGAFFLSRFRLDAKVYDPRTGKELNLLGQLKKQGQVDRQVWLGNQRIPVRLVAVKLPEAVAAERRRKARNNRDKRCSPSKRSRQLLGWAIFVTNVERQRCSAQTIARLYGLRWQIESLFKIWKSHFGLTEVPRGSSEQLLAMIYGRLLFLSVIARLMPTDSQEGETPPSPFKIAALFSEYILILCLEAWNIRLTDVFMEQLTHHARYERRTRRNSVQKLMSLS
jgi:hypothetical protein